MNEEKSGIIMVILIILVFGVCFGYILNLNHGSSSDGISALACF